MVPEASLENTRAGLVPASTGWFVSGARDARWFHRPGRGDGLPLTGWDEFEAETYFPMLGMSAHVLPPGEPNAVYHWETEQEDFLVLAGEALGDLAYVRFPPPQPTRYRDGLCRTSCSMRGRSACESG